VGDGKLKSAVADSGPLIHLAEIGCLRFLKVFDTIAIPDAVWHETVEQDRLSRREISSASNIQQYSPSHSEIAQFIKENNLTDLHAGEQECLYLCRQKNIPVLLTDDMAVRDAAKHLDFTAVGSLGIVVSAYKQKYISLKDAEVNIIDLYELSSLFVTRDIAELAIEQLRKHAKL